MQSKLNQAITLHPLFFDPVNKKALDVGSIPARDVLSKAECIRKISNMISAFLFFQRGNGMEYQLIRKESY